MLAQYIARHEAIRSRIVAAVEAAAPETLTVRPEGRWSAREVLIHLGNCAEACAADLTAFITGETLQREFLPPDEWNARELARFAHLDGPGALDYYRESTAELDRVAARLTDERHVWLLTMTSEHEAGHRYQLLEALALAQGNQREALVHALDYARSQVLQALNVEQRPAEALLWKPPTGKWSAAEHAIHLAVWDRYVALTLAAKAGDGPAPAEPFPEGGLDRFNEDTVAAHGWMSLGAVLHELGAARGDLVAQVRRLSAEQFATEIEGLRSYPSHDIDHANGIRRVLREWKKGHQA